MNAEVISIGDEITSGQSLDTNAQWLSQRIEELGVHVARHITVGDDLPANIEVFSQSIARADLVVATGGLGPTADDLTREALAQAVDRPLELDRESLEYIRAIFAGRGRAMPAQNELQAMFPAGSRVVRNQNGSAPGIDLDVPREGRPSCRVICLPGVPVEMIGMWNDSVAPAIAAMLGAERRVIRRRKLNCFGASESQIEAMLPDMIRRDRHPIVGITASGATISLRIAADGATEEECFAAMEPTVATIRQCLGTLVFGEEDDTLEGVVLRLLQERSKTIATAECVSAGLVAEWLGGAAESNGIYRGGLVLVDAHEDANALASRCREEFHADFGLAIGPLVVAGSEASIPATVGIALASPDGIQSICVPSTIHPALRRTFIAKQALNFVRLAMQSV